MLRGSAGDLLPPLLASSLERGPRGGVGPGGDHRPHFGHAQLGRLLDDQLHAIALERREREHEAQGRFRPRRDGMPDAGLDAAARDAVELGLELRSRAVEDPHRRSCAQAQHLARVVRGVLGQGHAPAGPGLGHVKPV